MKSLVIYILAILAILFVIDTSIGYFFKSYTRDYSLKGDYDNLRHILYECDDDVVVFGSSVALNSVDTKLLGDSLGLKCFNAASNGQTLYYHLTVMKSMLKNHSPKAILLGFISQDLSTEGIGDRYNFLSPYYKLGFEDIDKGFELNATESILLKSNLYRYNTIWWRILLYQFITPNEVGECGFIAKPIPPSFPTLKINDDYDQSISAERHEELKDFIETCEAKGVKLILFNPPEYIKVAKYESSNLHNELVTVARSYGIPLFDDTQDIQFLSHPEYFYDEDHLNKDGAKIYTSIMINRLKSVIQ